ncbi:MAG: hypothetical protein ACE5GH_02300 [Fidelibacterota bacterium]
MKRLKIRVVIRAFRLARKLRSYGGLLSIRRNGSGVKNALIILPEGRDNSRIARYFLKSLYQNGKVDLHFLMDRTLYHSFTGTLPSSVETYSIEDVGWFQLPKKEFVNRILNEDYHAVIDMHPSFNLPTAYLAYLSRAPVRVGFSSLFSHYFFNVEINRKSNDFIERGYLAIQKLLDL